MNEVINFDTICKWQTDGFIRRITPVSDSLLILNNNRSDLLLTLLVYINYAIAKFGCHVDFPRDACRNFFDEESPLRFYAEEAYKLNHDVDTYDENFGDVDVLADFIRTQDDYLIEKFIWYYLRALCRLDMTDPPEEYFEYFDEIVAEQLIVLINSFRHF